MEKIYVLQLMLESYSCSYVKIWGHKEEVDYVIKKWT